MIYRHVIGLMFLMGIVLWGCSGIQSSSKVVWTAQPEFCEMNHQLFTARIEPKKGETPYYAFFLLTIANKSDADLIVDWNASRYLINGRPQGMFVFEGIDPAMVKTATVPPETIPPGEVSTHEIVPLRLIAWNPIKKETAGIHGITPGILPAGENGIRLAVRHDGDRVTIPLSIRISKEDAP